MRLLALHGDTISSYSTQSQVRNSPISYTDIGTRKEMKGMKILALSTPGALSRVDVYTIATLDMETDSLTFLEVP